MGFWGDVIDTASRARRRREAREERENQELEDPTEAVQKTKGSWVFKLLSYVATIGLFIDVAIAILALTGSIKFSSNVLAGLLVIAVICFGCLMALPWIKYLLQRTNKILSIINLSFVGVQVVLWIISVVLITQLYGALVEGTGEMPNYATAINFIRAATFITIQIAIANSIMNTILQTKKKWIPFQIILYLSLLYIDFYVSTLIFSFNIGEDGFYLTNGVALIANQIVYVIAIIAFAYIILASAILNGGKRRKRKRLLANIEYENDDDKAAADAKAKAQAAEPASPKERLEKLKEMHDQGLITDDEFAAKRQEIIDKM